MSLQQPDLHVFFFPEERCHSHPPVIPRGILHNGTYGCRGLPLVGI